MNKKRIVVSILVLCLLLSAFDIPVMASGFDPYEGFSAREVDESKIASPSSTADYLGGMWANDWACYKELNFGKVAPYEVDLYTGTPSTYAGSAELRLDSPTGPAIAVFNPIVPSDWTKPEKQTAPVLVSVTGVHDLYIVSTSGTASFFKIQFHKVDTEEKFEYKEYSEEYGAGNIANSEYKREIKITSELNILPFASDGNDFMPKLGISRAECAEAMYRILGGDLIGLNNDSVFTDVDAESEYANAINFLHTIGVVKGSTDSEFYPNDFITPEEAITIACRTLGYECQAEEEGGFPAGCLKVANSAKISKGLAMGNVVTREELAKMLYNMIKADYSKISAVSESYVTYDKTKGILAETRGIYSDNGKVEANYLTSLYSPTVKADLNNVIINDTSYHIGNTQATELLGFDCEYYYTDVNNTKKIIAIFPENDVKMLDIEDYGDGIIESFTKNSISYYSEDVNKTKKINLRDNVKFIYNGVVLLENISDIFDVNKFNGKVRLIDNGLGYDTIIIDSFEDVVVESVDVISSKIIDKISKKRYNIDDNNDIIIFYGPDGKRIKAKEILSGDVVMIYESRNTDGEKFVRVYVVDNTVTGEVTMITNDSIYIENKEYKVASGANISLSPGAYGKFKLNKYNKIVDFKEAAADDFKIGLYMGVAVDTKGFDNKIKFKIYDGKEKSSVFECADNVFIDGIKFKDQSKAMSANGIYPGLDTLTEKTAVRYLLNDNNEISKIDTVLTGSGGVYDALKVHTSGSNTAYDWENGLVFKNGEGILHMSNNDTKLFWLGEDETEDEKHYVIDKPSNILKYPEWLYNNMTLYSSKGEDFEADICTIVGPVDYDTEGHAYMVVDYISTIVTDEKESALNIVGLSESGQKSYYVSEERMREKADIKNVIDILRKGDAVSIKADRFGEIESLQLILRYDLTEAPSGVSQPRLGNDVSAYGDNLMNERFIYGTVKEINDDGYVVINYGQDDKTEVLVSTAMVKVIKLTNDNGKINLHKNLTVGNVAEGDRIFVAIKKRQTVLYLILPDETE